jgi:hypothetical protein
MLTLTYEEICTLLALIPHSERQWSDATSQGIVINTLKQAKRKEERLREKEWA